MPISAHTHTAIHFVRPADPKSHHYSAHNNTRFIYAYTLFLYVAVALSLLFPWLCVFLFKIILEMCVERPDEPREKPPSSFNLIRKSQGLNVKYMHKLCMRLQMHTFSSLSIYIYVCTFRCRPRYDCIAWCGFIGFRRVVHPFHAIHIENIIGFMLVCMGTAKNQNNIVLCYANAWSQRNIFEIQVKKGFVEWGQRPHFISFSDLISSFFCIQDSFFELIQLYVWCIPTTHVVE